MVGGRQQRSVRAAHGIWLSVFVFEAVFKGGDLGHQAGALALGLLFTTLVVTELRSRREPPYDGPD